MLKKIIDILYYLSISFLAVVGGFFIELIRDLIDIILLVTTYLILI